jgi:hypothetical protein
MRRSCSSLLVVAVAFSFLLALGGAARADHTNPTSPLAPTAGTTTSPIASKGTWKHLHNFAANPGTDVKVFEKDGSVYTSSGTLGQGRAGHVGQRITRLVSADGKVNPTWVADHGSAACDTNNTSVTGLQHDASVTPHNDPEILIDTTDATGRCHDTAASVSGGLELVDISGLGTDGFQAREVHLTRHAGYTHTATVDDTRPWIVYNSTSDSTGRPWIDVLDIRSCLGNAGLDLAGKRAACRPLVYRIAFGENWSAQVLHTGELANESACHDITSVGTKLYCAALNGTVILDTAGMVNPGTGAVRGTPLDCPVVDGTRTGAKITDCSKQGERVSTAQGWRFVGNINHPGREDHTGPLGRTNTNTYTPSREGVAVAHEADPSHDERLLFVTDERGGGVIPPGASCARGLDNVYDHGGIHVFDISDPSKPEYARFPDGRKAVFVSSEITASPTFCGVHVIEHIPGEQRIVAAYYSQGAKIIDYFVNDRGQVSFKEVANFNLPGADTWTVSTFKVVDNPDGTKTYFFAASDIARGIDVFTYTGAPNPVQKGAKGRAAAADAPAAPRGPSGDAGLVLAGLVVLPTAALFGRRRR